MSGDDKPIFPRLPEDAGEEKEKLYEEARQRLENQEKAVEPSLFGAVAANRCSTCGTENPSDFPFCQSCGTPLSKPESKKNPPVPVDIPLVYGPPPMPFRARRPEPVAPAYGPPPISLRIRNKLIFWLIVGGVFILTAIGVYRLVIYLLG